MNLVCVGSISYWREIVRLDTVELQLNHSFQKQTSLSQFEIAGPNGRQKLSIPTVKKTRKGAYADVLIDHSTPWNVLHWRSILNSYSRSPFFLYYGDRYEAIFNNTYEHLIDLNLALFNATHDALKISKEIRMNSSQPVYFSEVEVTSTPVYPQVFDERMSFEPDLSVLDLLFNLGPETPDLLIQ